jgi:hypothetical protein
LVSSFKGGGDIELFSGHFRESKLLDQGKDNDRCDHGKVMNDCANTLVAAKGRELETTQEKDQPACSKTNNDGKEGRLQIVVVGIGSMWLMGSVVWVQVAEETSRREWITHSIQDKDGHNEEGKDFIQEASGKADIAGQVEKGSHEAVPNQPDRHPGIKGKERHTYSICNISEGSGEGKDRPSGSNHTQRHTPKDGVGDTDPRGGKHGFNGANGIVGGLSVDGTKSQGRGDDSNEKEESDSHSLEIEVDHFLEPVVNDTFLEILDDSSSPHCGNE